MKIILFYTYNQSFLSAFFKELALKLTECGHIINIVSLKESPDFLTITSNLTITILKKKNKWRDYISIFNLIKSQQPDVIISNFSYVNPSVLCGKLLGIKKNIVWFHTVTEAIKPNKKQILMKSLFLKLATKIIVNSDLLKNDIVKYYAISEEKIVAVPFWSPLENNHFKHKSLEQNQFLKIGCPGRIEEFKNHQIIIESLADISLPSAWKLYIAGNGDYEENLKLKILKSKLEFNVKLLGVLDITEMEKFYQEMDLIILPSKFEAFGLVLIEALSMGCHVLVSKNFGALTYIKDQDFLNKYSFDPNDSNDLKSKLQYIVYNSKDSTKYFKNIYKQYFQKEKIVAEVEAVINI
ncbi:glycosyltransferase family 4 protein [Gelidibacter japonicus]|uniref:glycosyltransferase family 4 protein n=1 Tax=Gelidibacter japonicus TaxID=1962232 RepID=UPI003A943737